MEKYGFLIKREVRKYLKEQQSVDNNLKLNPKFIPSLKIELSKYNDSESLLRSGGISIETLDRLAYGFSEEDIKQLMPEDLMIKWKDDLDNVKWEIKQSGLSPRMWASKIDLSEPIDVSYTKNKTKLGFYIEDGHHRYMAAKILKKPLNVNLTIKNNPIIVIAPNLGYDEFHRVIFNLFKNNKTITVYHGTKPKFIENIKENGLTDNTGYNQGWYMVSTDFESALFHAHSDENNDYVFVIEFEIPIEENNRWYGYPYLWKGYKRDDNSTWFALMQKLPAHFIKKIHKISYDNWIKQKNIGF